MQVIKNIDTIIIPLQAGQRTYYIPYKKKFCGTFRIGVSINAVDIDGLKAYPVGGVIDYTIAGEAMSTVAAAYITIAGEDGINIADGFNLSACRTKRYTHSPLEVCKPVNWDNSYISIPQSIADAALSDRAIFLNIYYTADSGYSAGNKRLVVDIPRDSAAEQRLSDFVVGYQGELVGIEVGTPTNILPLYYLDEDGYITINDAHGRCFEKVTLDNFQQTTINPYMGEIATFPRTLNPLRLQPIRPIWQNCKIYTGSDKNNYPDTLQLTFIFND